MLKKFLDNIPYRPLIIAAIILGLAPFVPVPHVVEKISMLFTGRLIRAIDIFDLFFHLSPALLLLVKWITGRRT